MDFILGAVVFMVGVIVGATITKMGSDNEED